MNQPIAVLISDVHVSMPTLGISIAALEQAITKANELEIPLVVAGDLHDTKALMRGECIAEMLKIFSEAVIRPIVIPGNHCRINERSDAHSLEFLRHCTTIIDKITYVPKLDAFCIPYYHDPDALRKDLKALPKDVTLIAHQGVQSASAGDYIQDKSALTLEDFSGFRVISGHYHTRQTIQLPDGGQFDYIGNPYSLTFGEAKDPAKGYQILHADGSLKFVPTCLRKHVIIEAKVEGPKLNIIMATAESTTSEDLVWVKLLGTKQELSAWNKSRVQNALGLPPSFRYDPVPTETANSAYIQANSNLSQYEQFVAFLNASSLDQYTKKRLTVLSKTLTLQ